ncbi:phosphatase PAP2 family protein [Bacillus cereus]
MKNRQVILIASFAILLCIFAFTDLQISNSLYEPTNKILVPMSRIVVGAHFASDVTVGVAISVTVFMCLKKIIWRDKKNKRANNNDVLLHSGNR